MKIFKRLLRLYVMLKIRKSEDYYKTAAQSQGIDPGTMTHDQISLWKAVCDQIEADIVIDVAFDGKHGAATKITPIEGAKGSYAYTFK